MLLFSLFLTFSFYKSFQRRLPSLTISPGSELWDPDCFPQVLSFYTILYLQDVSRPGPFLRHTYLSFRQSVCYVKSVLSRRRQQIFVAKDGGSRAVEVSLLGSTNK